MTKRNIRLIMILLIVAGGGALFFQNCGTQSFTIPNASTPPDANLTAGDAPRALSAAEILSIEFGAPEMNQVDTQSSSFKATGVNYRYTLNPTTGEITDKSSSTVIQNLTPEQLAQVKSLLENAKVETFSAMFPPDTMCTMDYRLPYARIFLSEAKTYDLGEGSSGCPQLDLYDQESGARLRLDQLLKQFTPGT